MKKVLITALVVLSLVLAVSCTTNYTVKFEANGGTPAPAAQTVAAGGVVVEPVSPAKTGYTFTGWYTDSTCATKYNFATKVNSSFTLYAGYDKNVEPVKKTYTVTFNSNGGSEVPSQTVTEGECATRPLNPTKAGYEFVDWYTAIGLEAGVAYSFTSKVESDLTLIAKWVDEAGAIIVTFEANGGVPAPGKQGADAAFYVIEPEAPAVPGYKFAGWYYDKALTTPFAFSSGKSTVKVYESMTLYAAYEDSGEFSISNGVLTAVNVKGPNATKDDPDYGGVTEITIPEGVKSIADGVLGEYTLEVQVGDYSYYHRYKEHYDGVFCMYPNLRTVVIPSSLEYVGSYAFANCDLSAVIGGETKVIASSTELVVPYVKKVGVGAFAGLNNNIESVVFKDLDVLDCNPFEYEAESVKKVQIEGADYIHSYAKAYLDTIKSLDCPAVVQIGTAGDDSTIDFNGCTELLSFYFPLIKNNKQFVVYLNGHDGAKFFVGKDVEIDSTTYLPVVTSFHAGNSDAAVIRQEENGMLLAKTFCELINATGVKNGIVGLDGDIRMNGGPVYVTDGVVFNFNGYILGDVNTICTLSGVDVIGFIVKVNNANELITAAKFKGATVVLQNDIDLKTVGSSSDPEDNKIVYVSSCGLTFDLNEKVITCNNTAFLLSKGYESNKVTIKNGTIRKAILGNEVYGTDLIITNGLDLGCENLKLVDDIGRGDSNGNDYSIVKANDDDNEDPPVAACVELKECEITLSNVATSGDYGYTYSAAVVANEGSTINLINCAVTSSRNTMATWEEGNSVINIYGGTYKSTSASDAVLYIFDDTESQIFVGDGEFDGVLTVNDGRFYFTGGRFKNTDVTDEEEFNSFINSKYYKATKSGTDNWKVGLRYQPYNQ